MLKKKKKKKERKRKKKICGFFSGMSQLQK